MEDPALRKMRKFVPNKKGRIKRYLKKETGWDGKFPVPFTYVGGCPLSQISGLNILTFSGDGHVIWVKDIQSASVLYRFGHNLVTDPVILAKRVSFSGGIPNNEKQCGRGFTVAFF